MPEPSPVPAAIAEPTPVMGAVRPQERIEVLDILRGFAIFGIVLTNFADYSISSLDHAAVRLIQFFIDGKFYTLFSFLFGLGLAIQMGRAEARGVRFVPIYLRRLSILLLIGLAHELLLWDEDILVRYAVLGFLLLLFRARSPKTLLVAALICLTITILFNPYDGQSIVSSLRRADPETAQAMSQESLERRVNNAARWQQRRRVFDQGTYAEMVAARVQMFVRYYSRVDRYIGMWGHLSILAMFLLGLYAGRRRIFQDIRAHLPFIRKVLWWGLGLGLVGNLVWVVALELAALNVYSLTPAVRNVFWFVGAPALCFFNAAAIILLFQREAWQKRLAPLAYVGRMALSNYLLQSLIFTTIYLGYGLGLSGKFGTALGLVLTAFMFALQILLSVWWLRRFQFGPMEWLWRSLTYGKLQPIRVQQVAAATR